MTGAYKRGGEEEVKYLLGVLDRVNDVPDEAELSEAPARPASPSIRIATTRSATSFWANSASCLWLPAGLGV